MPRGATTRSGTDQSRSPGSGRSGQQVSLVSLMFSPILLVHFLNLFLEQILSQSLDVSEVVCEEL